MSRMRVATASVNWGFDPYYTWVERPPFATMLDEMAKAGYEGTEISYNFPQDTDIIRHELDRRHLRPAATFHAVDLRNPGNHDSAVASSMKVADRLQALGSDVLILSDAPTQARMSVAGRVTAADGMDRIAWKSMVLGLHRIADRLRARGMRAVFHPHVGTFVETREEIDKFCELTDPALVALCPDTGHLAYAGSDPEQVFNDYANRIGYVHLKDVDPQKLELVRERRIDFVAAVKLGLFVELGTGMVQIDKIVASLGRAEYGGWLVVEQDAPVDPFASAKRNRSYLREHFAL